jgi:hypothetical protein
MVASAPDQTGIISFEGSTPMIAGVYVRRDCHFTIEQLTSLVCKRQPSDTVRECRNRDAQTPMGIVGNKKIPYWTVR